MRAQSKAGRFDEFNRRRSLFGELANAKAAGRTGELEQQFAIFERPLPALRAPGAFEPRPVIKGKIENKARVCPRPERTEAKTFGERKHERHHHQHQ